MFKNIIIAVLFSCTSMFSQNNPCGHQWSEWRTAITVSTNHVDYAYQPGKCVTSGICGSPKVKLLHTFPANATVSITLSGINCDGEVKDMSFGTGGDYISAGQEYIGQGNWHLFTTVKDVVRVEVAYYIGEDYHKVLYDKRTGINKVTINGKTAAEIQQEKQRKLAEEQKEQNRIADDKAREKQAAARQSAPQPTYQPQTYSTATTTSGTQQTQDYIAQRRETLQKNTDAVEEAGEAIGGIVNSLMTASQEKEDRRERAREEREEKAREARLEEQRQNQQKEEQRQREALAKDQKDLNSYNYYANIADNFYNAGDHVQALGNYIAADSYRKDHRCQYRIGDMYYNGLGTEVNMDEALKWFLMAAEQGNNDAKNDAGAVYEDIADYNNAFIWYQRAAEEGNELSITNLARLYSIDYLPEQYQQDLGSQVKWCEKYVAIAEMSSDVDLKKNLSGVYKLLALIYLGNNQFWNVEKGMFYFEKSAQEDVDSAYWLGRFYINGYLWGPDLQKGVSWIKRADENKHSGATIYLANLYKNGYKSITKDKIRSDIYYKKHLQQNIQFNIIGTVAAMYKKGIGTPKNYVEAVKWQKKYIKEAEASADTVSSEVGYINRGDYDFLGYIYSKGGYGVVKNAIEASKWYKKGFNILLQEREMIEASLSGEEVVAVDTPIVENEKPIKFNVYSVDLSKDIELPYLTLEGGDNDEYWSDLLGYRYEKGIGTATDALKAIEWYEKERKIGMYIPCDIGLMRIYSKAKDNDKVEEWYKKLQEDTERLLDEIHSSETVNIGAPAEAGELHYTIAVELEKEKSITGNIAKAKELYKRSAELGYEKANLAIARIEKPPVKKKK